MSKKTIITFLIFLAPIAFIQQHKRDKSSQITTQNFHMIEKNNVQIVNQLFKSNEEYDIKIKNCWEERGLASHKRYYSNIEKNFHNF